jgi:integrase
MALRIAQSWEEVAETRATETQARKVVSDIYRQVSGRNLLIPSFESYRDQWLQRKQAEVKPVTYAHYKSVAAAFVHFLGTRAAEPIHYVETADVARWRDELANRTSAKNANNRLKVLRCLFQSAWRDGISLDNPAAKVRTLRAEPSARRAFTQDELRAIFRVATGEWRGIILFGLYTGQRLADIVKLTWANFDPEAGVVRFTTNKTGRHQAIPLAPPVLTYISELAVSDDPEAPIFPQAWATVQRQGRTASLSNQFHGIMASAGLVEARPTRHVATTNTGRAVTRAANPLSFHSLRHTTTSMLKMSGVPEAVVRDIIGHDSELISRLYTHVGDDMKRQAIVHLPDFTAQPASQVA